MRAAVDGGAELRPRGWEEAVNQRAAATPELPPHLGNPEWAGSREESPVRREWEIGP